jgi:hypothetical protein
MTNIHFPMNAREAAPERSAMNGNVPPSLLEHDGTREDGHVRHQDQGGSSQPCRPSPFSKGQRANPAARPSSNGSSPVLPAQLSKKAQVTMIMKPTIAIVLHTRKVDQIGRVANRAQLHDRSGEPAQARPLAHWV